MKPKRIKINKWIDAPASCEDCGKPYSEEEWRENSGGYYIGDLCDKCRDELAERAISEVENYQSEGNRIN